MGCAAVTVTKGAFPPYGMTTMIWNTYIHTYVHTICKQSFQRIQLHQNSSTSPNGCFNLARLRHYICLRKNIPFTPPSQIGNLSVSDLEQHLITLNWNRRARRPFSHSYQIISSILTYDYFYFFQATGSSTSFIPTVINSTFPLWFVHLLHPLRNSHYHFVFHSFSPWTSTHRIIILSWQLFINEPVYSMEFIILTTRNVLLMYLTRVSVNTIYATGRNSDGD